MTNSDEYKIQQLIKCKRKLDELIKVCEEELAKGEVEEKEKIEEVLEKFKSEKENIQMELNKIYGRV